MPTKYVQFKSRPWMKKFYGAKQRCNNPRAVGFNYYGGRGIKMLLTPEEIGAIWKRDGADFMVKPSLDRIDPDGNYEFSNCRFIEHRENSGRRRNMRPSGCLICGPTALHRGRGYCRLHYQRIIEGKKPRVRVVHAINTKGNLVCGKKIKSEHLNGSVITCSKCLEDIP